jgi:hypothetical protein
MKHIYDDGGRAAAGYRGKAGDCVTRAIAIATEKPYQEVYDALNGTAKGLRQTRKARGSKARSGVYRTVFQRYLESLGWKWTPTMKVGQGCKVHLRADELPGGRVIALLSGHVVAVIDGVLHDTYDSAERGTTIYTIREDEEPKPYWTFLRTCENGQRQYAYKPERCVYGYYTK